MKERQQDKGRMEGKKKKERKIKRKTEKERKTKSVIYTLREENGGYQGFGVRMGVGRDKGNGRCSSKGIKFQYI
jgi:hypothetical protein